MPEMTQKPVITVEKDEKTLKNAQTEGKMTENTTKTSEKGTEAEDLKKQYADLKKKNPELVAKTRAIARGKINPKPKKEDKEEVTSMKEWRTPSERILIGVCKELKLAAPERIQAKAGSKSGVGALRVKLDNEVVLSVRSNDIVAFIPHSYMEVGKAEIAPYDKTVTKLNGLGEADLHKAMVKALKCKKRPSAWKKETGFSLASTPAVKKAAAIKETADDKIKRLNAELAEAKKAIKVKKEIKPKTRRDKVLAKVAGAITHVNEPAVA